MKKIWLIIFLEVFILSNEVFAYINPGMGAAVVGSIWPLILVFLGSIGAFLIKIFWKPIKKSISKIKNKKEQISNENILLKSPKLQ